MLRSFTLLLISLLPSALIANEADRVVVVVNSNDPGSLEIAQHYVAVRGIPSENIISISTSTKETVTVREYVDTIYNPLLSALVERGWVEGARSQSTDHIGRYRMSLALHTISYLVTTRGVPLRIANDSELMEPGTEALQEILQVNCGAVDSDLAVMAVPGQLPLASMMKNPYFQNLSPSDQDKGTVLRVCRLDGISVGAVKKLINRSLEAERVGLRGRAYFDIGGPHKAGDQWFGEAAELAKAVYFDRTIEKSKRPMDDRDRLDAPAIYMGWYRPNVIGPWRQPRWDVPAGAIGFHLHSFSATTIRQANKGWVGPFVEQGYCATIGNVYEPYLEFTHRPQLLLGHLLKGGTFGEAAAHSYPVTSWMGIAVGDPLYRPFTQDLDAQLKLMDEPMSAYVALREINRLQGEEGSDSAIGYARSQFMQNPSLALAYRLAQLHDEADDGRKAVEALKVIRYIDFFGKEERVLVSKIANLLHKHGESRMAYDVYAKLLAERTLPKWLRVSLLEQGSKIAMAAGETTAGSQWTMKARQLKQPQVKK